ncbi:MAG: MFS transporter [Limisphaerales bacterium]
MYSRQVKNGVFILEGLNALATTYYFYYIYFLMQKQFGFGALQNLLLAAGLGFIYAFAAVFGGRVAQKRGCFFSLKIGFFILATALLAGSQVSHLSNHLVVMVVGTVGMCFTWPAFQAIISENEPRLRLQSLLGVYNLTWAGASALAYFTGGAMIEKLGLKSMFLVPGGVHFVQFIFTFWLEKKAALSSVKNNSESKIKLSPLPENKISSVQKTFLKMAWLANPFAYLAVNTLIPVIPTLAKELNLSPQFAGFSCSVWFFARAGSFVLLRFYPGWHYRFLGLVVSYAAMILSFAAMLLIPNLWVLVLAQIIFGLSLGLIYYSSIFYSMDVGETKGDHAGIHEGAIGAGTCVGPAIGAAALYFFPARPHSAAWTVSGLLLTGLVGLIWLYNRKEKG